MTETWGKISDSNWTISTNKQRTDSRITFFRFQFLSYFKFTFLIFCFCICICFRLCVCVDILFLFLFLFSSSLSSSYKIIWFLFLILFLFLPFFLFFSNVSVFFSLFKICLLNQIFLSLNSLLKSDLYLSSKFVFKIWPLKICWLPVFIQVCPFLFKCWLDPFLLLKSESSIKNCFWIL